MSLRSRISIHLAVIFSALGVLAYGALRPGGFSLLAVEGLVVVALIAAGLLLHSLMAPSDLIQAGAEGLRNRDFTSHFRRTGVAEIDVLVDAYNEMVDQLRRERQRQQEQQFFLEKILAASPGGVITLDPDGRINYLNRTAAQLLEPGAEPIGSRLEDLESPLAARLTELAPPTSRVLMLAGGRKVRCTRAEYFDRGAACGFFLIEELTEELRNLEREAYETLIRLMSHEINNSVAAVISLLDSCREYRSQLVAEDSADFDHALTVAISRMTHLNAFMKGFADVVRLPSPVPQSCDLHQLIREIRVLLEPELERRSIGLAIEDGGDVPPIRLDKNQFEQVLVNLLKNSIDAIGEGGRITIRLESTSRGPRLTILDTGSGLPDEAQTKIFTPFFTTKRDGRGLGLTLTREILTQHGFEFSLDNRPEGGARFTIYMQGS